MEREPWARPAPMTGDERRVFELFSQGRRTDEVAAHLGISRDQVVELMLAVLTKLQARSTPPDPPPPPLAASAALAIPYQRAEDLPRHVGRVFPRKRSPRSPTR